MALADLVFPVVLATAIAREIIKGRNWRNLVVLVLLTVLILGNGVFHWEAARGGYAAQGMGLRLGLGAAIMMIAVMAGGSFPPSRATGWSGATAPSCRPRRCSGSTDWRC